MADYEELGPANEDAPPPPEEAPAGKPSLVRPLGADDTVNLESEKTSRNKRSAALSAKRVEDMPGPAVAPKKKTLTKSAEKTKKKPDNSKYFTIGGGILIAFSSIGLIFVLLHITKTISVVDGL